MIAFVIPVALLAGGMAAGGLMISALGGAPMLLSLSVEHYLAVWVDDFALADREEFVRGGMELAEWGSEDDWEEDSMGTSGYNFAVSVVGHFGSVGQNVGSRCEYDGEMMMGEREDKVEV